MQWPRSRRVSPTHHHGFYTPIAVDLRSRRLTIIHTSVLDVLPLSQMLTQSCCLHFDSGRLLCTNYYFSRNTALHLITLFFEITSCTLLADVIFTLSWFRLCLVINSSYFGSDHVGLRNFWPLEPEPRVGAWWTLKTFPLPVIVRNLNAVGHPVKSDSKMYWMWPRYFLRS